VRKFRGFLPRRGQFFPSRGEIERTVVCKKTRKNGGFFRRSVRRLSARRLAAWLLWRSPESGARSLSGLAERRVAGPRNVCLIDFQRAALGRCLRQAARGNSVFRHGSYYTYVHVVKGKSRPGRSFSANGENISYLAALLIISGPFPLDDVHSRQQPQELLGRDCYHGRIGAGELDLASCSA